MMSDKQSQKSGDHSQSAQAGRDVVTNNYYGLGKDEVIALALKTLEKNMPTFLDEAKRIIDERGKAITEKIVIKLIEEDASAFDKFSEPSVQNDFIKTQKSYALNGGEELKDILTKVFIDRLKCENRTTEQITNSEVIEVLPKIPIDQINFLSAYYIVNYLTPGVEVIGTWGKFITYLEENLIAMLIGSKINSADVRNLTSTGCCNRLTTPNQTIYSKFKIKFSGFFSRGFTAEDAKEANIAIESYSKFMRNGFHDKSKYQFIFFNVEDFIEALKNNGVQDIEIKKLRKLFTSSMMDDKEIRELLLESCNNWVIVDEFVQSNSFLNGLEFSNIGFVIATTNLFIHTGLDLDYSLWYR